MTSKKLLTFSLIILIFIIIIGAVSATDNTTQTDDKNFQDLQSEIDGANENDVIELEGTYSSEGKQIKIDKSLTIQGNATLDGKSSSRIIATNKNVTFKNLTFINGVTTKGGGAVYSTSENNILTFIGCTFINNKADTGELGAVSTERGGGAIMSLAALNIINCTFKDNFAQYGSAIKYCGNTINVENSQFIHNYGGDAAIYSWAFSKIENTNFTNNTGNAIYSSFKIIVKNCNFINNNYVIECEQDGEIENCNFINNKKGIEKTYTYNKVTIKNSNFYQNDIAITINSDSSMDNLTLIDNNIAILSSYWSDEPFYAPDSHKITISNTLFKSNKKGAISNQYNNLKINDCYFVDNYADYGAAIKNTGGTVTIINSTLTNNTPASLVSVDIVEKDDVNPNTLFSKDGIIKINNTKFQNVNLDDNLNKVELIKVSAPAVNTVYYSGDKLIIKITNINTSKPVEECEIELTVVTGKKSKTYLAWSNSKGIAKFSASTLDAGPHKVEISAIDPCASKKTTTTIKVKKAKTIVKAPKVTNKYKKSAYFKVTVKNKVTKKAAKKAVLKLKIGEKTYNLKTNKKGIAKFNTKSLKVGTYKVKITSGNANYKISAKSTIKIKW